MTIQRTKKGSKQNLNLKRMLRSQMTPAENRLWLQLRVGQFQNLKFRRQHGIGQYIVDFFCAEKRLAIEVDGDIHAFEEQIKRDKKREDYLKNIGIQIIRYNNHDILTNIEEVMDDLFRRINLYSTSPNPSLQRRGIKMHCKEDGLM